jgi:hypothetical protein
MIVGCSHTPDEAKYVPPKKNLPPVNAVVPKPAPRPQPVPQEDLGKRSARFADYGDANARKVTTACVNYQTIVTANGGAKGWCGK